MYFNSATSECTKPDKRSVVDMYVSGIEFGFFVYDFAVTFWNYLIVLYLFLFSFYCHLNMTNTE